MLKVLVLTPENELKLLDMNYSALACKEIVDSTPSIFISAFYIDGALASKISPNLVDTVYKIVTELGMKITAFAGEYCTDKRQ